MADVLQKPTSNVFATGGYNTNIGWASASMLLDEYRPEVYQLFGPGVRFNHMLELAGQVENVTNSTYKHYERYSPNNNITLLTAIASGTGSKTFKIETDDYDSNNKPSLRKYEVLYITAKYMSGVNETRNYWVSDITGTTNDLTFTILPVNADGTYNTASSIVSSGVPVGTTLIKGNTLFAPGTGYTTPETETFAVREHVAAILGDSVMVEGGQMAQNFQKPVLTEMKNGQRGFLFQPIREAEIKLDKHIENYILTGERTDNANMIQTSQAGSYSAAVKSGFGIMKTANIYSQETYWQGQLDITDFQYRGLLLQSQGVVNQNVTILCGPEYMNMLENSGLNILQQYSVTNLLDNTKKLGVDFKSYMFGGNTYTPIQLAAFTDPTTFGMNLDGEYSSEYASLGLYIPDGKTEVKVEGKKKKLSSVTIGYVNANGEDRTRMVGMMSGPNNMLPSQLVSDQYDRLEAYAKSELMVICTCFNQTVLDRKVIA